MAAAAAGDPVVVTGCGTSEHAAVAVAELLTDAFRRAGHGARAEARQALDAAFEPRLGGVCIAISHDGGTRATQLALEAARESGATSGADHGLRRSRVRVRGRHRLRHSRPRRLVVPHARLRERHPGRGEDRRHRRRRGRQRCRERDRVDAGPSHGPPGRRRAPGPLRPHRGGRPRHGPGERERARPQDRRGRAHPHHRLPPRDAPPRPSRRV